MIEQQLLQYGYILVVLGTLVEGDATMLAGGFLAHQGQFSVMAVAALGALTTLLANQLVYGIARHRGRALFEKRVARHKRYARIKDWVCRRGALLLFCSRFLFGFRIAVPAACGAVGMNPVLFFTINTVGALVWAAVFCAIGFYFGRAFGGFLHGLRDHLWAIGGFMAVGAVLYFRLKGWDRKGLTTLVRHPDHLAAESVWRVGKEAHHPGHGLLTTVGKLS